MLHTSLIFLPIQLLKKSAHITSTGLVLDLWSISTGKSIDSQEEPDNHLLLISNKCHIEINKIYKADYSTMTGSNKELSKISDISHYPFVILGGNVELYKIQDKRVLLDYLNVELNIMIFKPSIEVNSYIKIRDGLNLCIDEMNNDYVYACTFKTSPIADLRINACLYFNGDNAVRASILKPYTWINTKCSVKKLDKTGKIKFKCRDYYVCKCYKSTNTSISVIDID